MDDPRSEPGSSATLRTAPRTPQVDATHEFQPSDEQTAAVVELLDQYLVELKAGRNPDRQKLLSDHPELAAQLEACLAGIDFIHSGGGTQPKGKRLGDFRVLREVGHGGMGAVYEAEQISLGRRVALKVLRFGAVSDQEAVQRFQREAETIGRLHHTNIVPIFSVGSEGGVNYYTMQFIDGRSLDQVLQAEGKPIASRTVAEWGLQAAEALAHAHARGVIHRDVKPSNLLIDDDEGRIWLTDFGLAKRLDDVTLSMTGALLGTPRYMSPEQAASANQKIDHRTDLYSLGATLYELATNRPVFTGEAPHQVISQILTRDPDPPRKHVPSLPRDLDTILMKCLAKSPQERYSSARQLADDLRAFVEGRPIAARRAGPIELASRWLKRQQRSVTIGTVAAATTLALVVFAAAGSYLWHRSRLASLMLKTDRPPLVAELFDSEGEPVVPRVTVPTLQHLEIPAGDYEMRLSGDGRLSQTFQVHLDRGQSHGSKLDLDDQLLWGELKLERAYRLVRIVSAESTRTDVVHLTEQGIQLVAGDSGLVRWTQNLVSPEKPLLKEGVKLIWPWDRQGSNYGYGLGMFDGRPFVVSAPESEVKGSFDFNGDGTSDLVLAPRHQPWLLAISSVDGQPLWIAARGNAAATSDQPHAFGGIRGGVLHAPTIIDDQDGDGVADIAASLIEMENHDSGKRWIELLSGKTGASLWREELPGELFELPAGQDIPELLRWYYGSGGGYSSGGSGFSANGDYVTFERGQLGRNGYSQYSPTPVAWMPRESALGFIAGTHFVVIDPRTGQATTTDIGVRSGLEPRYGDFDGDGRTDLLLATRLPDMVGPRGGLSPGNIPQLQLTAWSPARQLQLWQQVIDAPWPQQTAISLPPPQWPLVADFEGDGVSEIITPTECSSRIGAGQTMPYGTVAVLEGRTGKRRWQRRVMNSYQQLDWFLRGPDINGDGIAEVYVAAIWGRDGQLFVDCFSGSDGETLWQASHRLLHSESEFGDFCLGNPSWFDNGNDGWPQLMIPAQAGPGEASDRICFFSAGTGKLSHVATAVSDVQSADFDADGVDDLALFHRADKHQWDRGGTLSAIHGGSRETWRAATEIDSVVGDIDGDGIFEFVSPVAARKLALRSGATGKTLWVCEEGTGIYDEDKLHAAGERDARSDLLQRIHDLNGDSVPDLLLVGGRGMRYRQQYSVLQAISGRTGKRIWRSEVVAQVVFNAPLVECRDLDGDGEAEVVFVGIHDYKEPLRSSYGGTDARLWLCILSGSTGRVKWAEPLCAPQNQGHRYNLERVWLETPYADLNGDSVLDLVLPVQAVENKASLEMRAFSGKDGAKLWQVPVLPDEDLQELFGNMPPAAVGDLDGDGKQEACLLSFGTALENQAPARFVQLEVVEGATGQSRWSARFPVDAWSSRLQGNADRVKNRLRPLLIHRPDGKQWVALLHWANAHQIHVLDERGRVVSKLAGTPHNPGNGTRLWPVDAEGDGGEELLLLSEDALKLLPPDRLDQPLWQRSKSTSPTIDGIVGILNSEAAVGKIVVLGGRGKDHSLFGLDPTSGQTVWQCLGPCFSFRRPANEIVRLLGVHTDKTPASALFRFNHTAFARVGVPTAGDSDDWQASARTNAATEYDGVDPRLLRTLPWKPSDHEIMGMPKFLAWAFFYGGTMVALPIGYVVYIVRRRRWGLKTLLALPAVAGVFLLGATLNSPNMEMEFSSIFEKLSVGALLSGPWIFAVFAVTHWVRKRSYGALAGWLIAAVVVLALIVVATLLGLFPPQATPLRPGEHWSWEGWYYVFLPVGHTIVTFMLMLVPTWWAITAVRNYWKARRTSAALKVG